MQSCPQQQLSFEKNVKEKSGAIVLCADKNFLPHAVTVVQSLNEIYASRVPLPIYIITDPSSWELQSKSVEHCLEYYRSLSISIEVIVLQEAQDKKLPTRFHLNSAAYYRLWIPEVLAYHDYCLYLDCDLLVRRRICSLLNPPKCDEIISATPGSAKGGEHLQIPDGYYYNSGVMRMNLSALRELQFLECSLEWIMQNSQRIRWADQDVINSLFHQSISRLGVEWNFQFIHLHQLSTVNPHIVHFNGSKKPWQYGCTHPFTRQYRMLMRRSVWPKCKIDDFSFRNLAREVRAKFRRSE